MTLTDRALLNAILRNDLVAFFQRCFMTLNPKATFLPNWHIEAIAYHLELVRTGKIQRLIINMPPRSFKSIACSVAFPAFVLGQDPSKRIVVVSYGSNLAVKHANDCRAILQCPWYLRAFPGTRIARNKNTETEIATTRYGFRLATSVGGTLTGRGGDILIIDDPLKPQDAYSESKRGAANEWFDNTLLTRLDDKQTGAIVVVMQRLHADDLTGKLLRNSDGWTVLNLPAIAEKDEQILIGEDRYFIRKEGDLLHAERENLQVLKNLRAAMGPDLFAAQYQQNPTPPGGNMIKRHWIRRYEKLPPRTSSTRVMQSYDTASKEGEKNSYSVCSTFYVCERKYYLADVLRKRLDYPTLKARAFAHAQLHKPTDILIEDTGVGTALAAELRSAGYPAIAIKVEQNKETRMSIQSAKFESGQIFFPHSAPWLEQLEEELCAFPAGRHDDQVDSISQALAYEIKKAGGWTNESVQGLANVANALAFDAYLGRMTGRPW